MQTFQSNEPFVCGEIKWARSCYHLTTIILVFLIEILHSLLCAKTHATNENPYLGFDSLKPVSFFFFFFFDFLTFCMS